MVIQRGLVAIANEIKKRINACVPTAYSTDTFIELDKDMREGENDLPVDQWRRYYVTMRDMDKGSFDGNYVYSNKVVGVTVHMLYSESGANRVIGTPDVDFDALALQDVDDIEKALRGHIWTDDGCSARLLFSRSSVSSDGIEAEIFIDFEMPVFLRGTAAIQDLFIGPDMAHTLNEGTKFYLVLVSDLACSVALASSPAGCTHDSSVALSAGSPQIVEVTCSTANTYTFSVTSENGGSDTCEVQVYPASDFVLVGPDHAVPNDQWTLNLAVAAANNGIFPVAGSANLTLPENVTIVNNKGVIPVTITARGSHSVSVGGDTCNFTSVTPAAKIPKIDPFHFVDIYGVKGTYYGFPMVAGCIDPRVENYACMSILGDNTRRFTLAAKIKMSAYKTTDAIMGVQPTQSYNASPHVGLITSGAFSLMLYYADLGGTTRSVSTGTALVSDSNWYSYVFDLFYDRNTSSGYCDSWRNGVYINRYAITNEPGYLNAGWFHKFLITPLTHTLEVRDIYISNDTLWTQTEVDAYHGETTVDPAKYTLHWTCEKNTDLPYHVEYDSKNNMPLSFFCPTDYLTWVPKP